MIKIISLLALLLTGCSHYYACRREAEQQAVARREAYIQAHPSMTEKQKDAIRSGRGIWAGMTTEALQASNALCHPCGGPGANYRGVQVDLWACDAGCGGTALYVRDGKLIGWLE